MALGLAVSFAIGTGPEASSPGGENRSGEYAIVDFALEIMSQIGWILLPLILVWLLLRRLSRLALLVTTVGTGAVALDLGLAPAIRVTGALLPPLDATAVITPDSLVLFATVTLGVLLLVLLPFASAAARAWTIVAVTLADAAIVSAAVVAQQRYASVAIGWLIALTWLAVATMTFLRWQRALERLPHGPSANPPPEGAVPPAPIGEAPLPGGWRSGLTLVLAAVLLCAGLIGSGLLITRHLAPVRQFDAAVIDGFVDIRTPVLTAIAHIVDPLSNTPGIIMALLTAVTLASAVTRRWAPVLFLVTATAGETAIFLFSQAVVGRPRPSVEHLTGLPATLAYPSGHIAASTVTYGAIALLLVAWAGRRVGAIAVALAALIVLGVALTRFYVGMHYPTDALASVLFGVVWLAVCWHAFRPDRGAKSLRGSAE